MTTHTPIIRLQAARSAFRFAEEQCPHWDFDDDVGHEHDCCIALRNASVEYHLAQCACRTETA